MSGTLHALPGPTFFPSSHPTSKLVANSVGFTFKIYAEFHYHPRPGPTTSVSYLDVVTISAAPLASLRRPQHSSLSGFLFVFTA